jgi:hypothetical protein
MALWDDGLQRILRRWRVNSEYRYISNVWLHKVKNIKRGKRRFIGSFLEKIVLPFGRAEFSLFRV